MKSPIVEAARRFVKHADRMHAALKKNDGSKRHQRRISNLIGLQAQAELVLLKILTGENK